MRYAPITILMHQVCNKISSPSVTETPRSLTQSSFTKCMRTVMENTTLHLWITVLKKTRKLWKLHKTTRGLSGSTVVTNWTTGSGPPSQEYDHKFTLTAVKTSKLGLESTLWTPLYLLPIGTYREGDWPWNPATLSWDWVEHGSTQQTECTVFGCNLKPFLRLNFHPRFTFCVTINPIGVCGGYKGIKNVGGRMSELPSVNVMWTFSVNWKNKWPN